MKKLLCAILSVALTLCLFACTFQEPSIQAPVEFFYLRSSFEYGTGDGVISSELREASGHMGDLRYMLLLYLQGPLDPNLTTPFPSGCRVVDIEESGDELTVTLNSSFSTLKDMELSLACVCLAKTCMSLSEVQTVHIEAPSVSVEDAVSITVGKDALVWEDVTIPSETETP